MDLRQWRQPHFPAQTAHCTSTKVLFCSCLAAVGTMEFGKIHFVVAAWKHFFFRVVWHELQVVAVLAQPLTPTSWMPP